MDLIPGEELEKRLQSDEPVLVSNVRVKTAWKGSALNRTRAPSVMFQNCHFERGFHFIDITVNCNLVFYNCLFSRCAHVGGTLSVIQNCTFGRPLTFRNCTFSRSLMVWDSMFDAPIFFGSCDFRETLNFSTIARLASARFSGSTFDRDIQFNVEAQGQLAFVDCNIRDTLQIQDSILQGGLDLSKSKVKSAGYGEPLASIILDHVTVVGNIYAEDITFEPGQAGQLKVSTTSFEVMRGLSWTKLNSVIKGGTDQDYQVFLAESRKSYDRQGASDDANRAFLALKAHLAQRGNWLTKLIHYFMLQTSAWGTDWVLLTKRFFTFVLIFAALYFSRVFDFGAQISRPIRLLYCLTYCFAISFGVTLLQYDPDDFQDIDELGARADAKTRAQTVMRVQRLLASLVLLMLGAYLGSLLTGGF